MRPACRLHIGASPPVWSSMVDESESHSAPRPRMPAAVPPSSVPAISPDAPLVPLPPFEAYAADVHRLGGRAPIGPADDAWIVLAHALARAGSLPLAERGAVFAGGARVVGESLPAADAPAVEACHTAAHALADVAARRGGLARDAGRVTAAIQQVVAHQEQAGAFLLAFATLAATRDALAPALDARHRGLLLAQQGRVARQLGALTPAARLYRAAARAGREAGDFEVRARALLGCGVLANMRGNYPEARLRFRRALSAARRAHSQFLQRFLQRAAHHGLLLAALAAEDADTALAHGWVAFRHTPKAAVEDRAEALLNLGEAGRLAGEPRAALGACLSAIELTDLPRLCLPALGTAARAAAALGEHRLLEFLARDVERVVARSGQQFENARAIVELAEAFDGYRNDVALRHAARAHALGVAGSFHEVTARALAVIDGLLPADMAAPADVTAVRSPRARAVLRTLETMPAVQEFTRLAAC